DRPTVTEVYTEQLILRGDLTAEQTEAIDEAFHDKLVKAQHDVKSGLPVRAGMRGYEGHWHGLTGRYSHAPADTAVPYENLLSIPERLTTVPDDFPPNPKIAKLLEARRDDVRGRKPLDWSTGEALAFGSLLLEGTEVRLSGQDSRRGTFSQRHAVLYDAR